jgi:hypothetical protein
MHDFTTRPDFVQSRWTLLSVDDPRILIVNRDITEKKRTEEALLRTQRLENLGAMASGIVHDLNNVAGAHPDGHRAAADGCRRPRSRRRSAGTCP